MSIADRTLLVESNTALRIVDPARVEVRFLKDGAMRLGQFEIRDYDELIGDVTQYFPAVREGNGVRGTVKRVGKYQRIDDHGVPIFTFGDPILDLITDSHGFLVFAGRQMGRQAIERAEPAQRGGGIRSIDLGPHVADLARAYLAAAVAGSGDLTLLECEGERLVFAARNPSRLELLDGSAKLTFRTFSRNWYVFKKLGCIIETTGSEFETARFTSEYGYEVGVGHVCAVAKTDSDSETNDDYVDEYEWAVGADVADGVWSHCQARWRGHNYAGTVNRGCNDGMWF